MKDISLHILDVLENSAKAGATEVALNLKHDENWLTVQFSDNGPGFPEQILQQTDPADPFYTSRTERQVGLGLSLLRQSAEQTGGIMNAFNHRNTSGCTVRARFNMAHIDAVPLGDVPEAVLTAAVAWPNLNLRMTVDDTENEVLNTKLVRQELGDVDITHPAVRQFLRETMQEALSELTLWTQSLHQSVEDLVKNQNNSHIKT